MIDGHESAFHWFGGFTTELGVREAMEQGTDLRVIWFS